MLLLLCPFSGKIKNPSPQQFEFHSHDNANYTSNSNWKIFFGGGRGTGDVGTNLCRDMWVEMNLCPSVAFLGSQPAIGPRKKFDDIFSRLDRIRTGRVIQTNGHRRQERPRSCITSRGKNWNFFKPLNCPKICALIASTNRRHKPNLAKRIYSREISGQIDEMSLFL